MTAHLHTHPTSEDLAAHERSVRALPESLCLDDMTNDSDVNRLIVLHRYLRGELAFWREDDIARVPHDHRLQLRSAQMVRSSMDRRSTDAVWVGRGFAANVRRYGRGDVVCRIAARDAATADAVLDEVRAWSAPAPALDDGLVSVGFSYNSRHRRERESRTITASRWTAIAHNYATRTRAEVDALIALDPECLPSGRLLLLHGEQGTGKTSLLRTLAREWSSWCRTEFVLDADQLFGDLGYLMRSLLEGDETEDDGDGDVNDGHKNWRLLVLEDCDELLRSDAKQVSGQALSRLLNVCDGVLGQGSQLLVCLTTNEPIQRLHPAVTRPRRCLANIEVPRLSRLETLARLRPGISPPTHGCTLAELLELEAGRELTLAPAIGHYL